MSGENQSAESSSQSISPSQADPKLAETSAANQLNVPADQARRTTVNVDPSPGSPGSTLNLSQLPYLPTAFHAPASFVNVGSPRAPVPSGAGHPLPHNPLSVHQHNLPHPQAGFPQGVLYGNPSGPMFHPTLWLASPESEWRNPVPQHSATPRTSPSYADTVLASQTQMVQVPAGTDSPYTSHQLPLQELRQQDQHVQQRLMQLRQNDIAKEEQDILAFEHYIREKKAILAQKQRSLGLRHQQEFQQQYSLQPPPPRPQETADHPFFIRAMCPPSPGQTDSGVPPGRLYGTSPLGRLEPFPSAFVPPAPLADSTMQQASGMPTSGTNVLPVHVAVPSEHFYAGAACEVCPVEQEQSVIISTQNVSFVTRDSHISGASGQLHPTQLREGAEEFVPRPQPQVHVHRGYSIVRGRRSTRHGVFGKPSASSAQEDAAQQNVKQLLHNYALRALAPFTAPAEALEHVRRTVTRVPAVCFNEQKFEECEEYKVLMVPQSPARRGQESLARVCFALEESLRRRDTGATIISDYKFKESYLKNAPKKFADVLPTVEPEAEGSHNILIVGMEFGIACVQVTCVEASTNSMTIKKQVRETLKQLEKDVKVVKHLLHDLQLDDRCIRKVLALPNITPQKLKEKLDSKFVKVLQSALDTDDDLQDFLTLDCLPGVGHRHWSARQLRDRLDQWFERLVSRTATISVEDYMQIFARYTGSWSVSEVWGMHKPRFQVRSLAHAVSLTAQRHRLSVLTPQQHELLLADQSHVLIEAPLGSGATCLLKIKIKLELQRGSIVLAFLPRVLYGLREDYEAFAATLTEKEHVENMFFWSSEEGAAAISAGCLTSTKGEVRTLESLHGKRIFAVCDLINRDERLIGLMMDTIRIATSTWIAVDTPTSLPLSNTKFHLARFATLTRVPTSVQALLRYGFQRRSLSPPSSPLSAAADLQATPSQTPTEVSSYLGLPTDGPSPLFIWHPVETHVIASNGVLQCAACMTRLRSLLMDLVPEFVSDEFAAETAEGKELVEPDGSEDLDIDSGNVPQPLTSADVVIFVESKEDVSSILRMLNVPNVENMVFPLADLPCLIGREKTVVVFVGGLDADGEADDTIMHAVVSKLRDVITLCQGQLILALQVTPSIGQLPDQAGQLGPFQLDIETMLEKAEAIHRQ